MRRERRADLLQLASLPQDAAQRDCTGDREIHSPSLMSPSPTMASFTAIIGSFRLIHMLIGTFLDGRRFGRVIPVSFVVLSQCVSFWPGHGRLRGVCCAGRRAAPSSPRWFNLISLYG